MADDISIDFSDVKDVRIPQGTVKYIEKYKDGVAGPLYWKRPFQYPTIGFYFRANLTKLKVIVHNLPWGLRDQYGMNRLLKVPPTSTNSDGSINVYYQEPIIWLPTEDDTVDEKNYSSTFTWIKHGVISIPFHTVDNETKAEEFPTTSRKTYLSFSSAASTFKLYAIPESTSGDWAFGKIIETEPYQELKYKLIEHETDVTVTTSQMLIQEIYVNSADKYYIGVKKVCSNFDWYKNYYDTATEGKFPKSTYPYLVGVEALAAKTFPSQSNIRTGLNNGLMYLGFKVKR